MLTFLFLDPFPSPVPLLPLRCFLPLPPLSHMHTNPCIYHSEFMLTLCTQDHLQELVSPANPEPMLSGSSEALLLSDTTHLSVFILGFPSCLGRSRSAAAKNYFCGFLRDQGPGRNPDSTWGTSETFPFKLKKGCSLGSEMGKGSCYSEESKLIFPDWRDGFCQRNR